MTNPFFLWSQICLRPPAAGTEILAGPDPGTGCGTGPAHVTGGRQGSLLGTADPAGLGTLVPLELLNTGEVAAAESPCCLLCSPPRRQLFSEIFLSELFVLEGLDHTENTYLYSKPSPPSQLADSWGTAFPSGSVVCRRGTWSCWLPHCNLHLQPPLPGSFCTFCKQWWQQFLALPVHLWPWEEAIQGHFHHPPPAQSSFFLAGGPLCFPLLLNSPFQQFLKCCFFL